MDKSYIVFDCDGVLVDTEIVAADAMLRQLASLGVEVSKDSYLANHAGKTFWDIFQSFVATGQLSASLPFVDIISKTEQEVAESLVPIAGAQAALSAMPLPLAAVSNSQTWHVAKALQCVGVAHLFGDRVFSAEMVEKPKPSPLVYLHAARSLSTSPEKCIVVEDSPSGVAAAVAAGMDTVGFTGASHILPGHGQKLLQLGAKAVVSHMSHLSQVLGEYW